MLHGFLAVALVAVAGAMALPSAAGRTEAAVIAFVSTAVAVTPTFLDCDSRRDHHLSLSAIWHLDRHLLRTTQTTNLRPILHAQHPFVLPSSVRARITAQGVKIRVPRRGHFSRAVDRAPGEIN